MGIYDPCLVAYNMNYVAQMFLNNHNLKRCDLKDINYVIWGERRIHHSYDVIEAILNNGSIVDGNLHTKWESSSSHVVKTFQKQCEDNRKRHNKVIHLCLIVLSIQRYKSVFRAELKDVIPLLTWWLFETRKIAPKKRVIQSNENYNENESFFF